MKRTFLLLVVFCASSYAVADDDLNITRWSKGTLDYRTIATGE